MTKLRFLNRRPTKGNKLFLTNTLILTLKLCNTIPKANPKY